MTALLRDGPPGSFKRRIAVALAALAAVAALQGAFAVWAVGLAEHHVLRGRVAADIRQEFTAFWLDKQQLRDRVARTQAGAGAGDERRDALLRRMRATLDSLDTLAGQIAALDGGTASLPVHGQRREALAILRWSLDRLAAGIAAAERAAPGMDGEDARRTIERLFDDAEGRDLRSLLDESLAREAASLDQKRIDTDETLAWLRRLWIGTTGLLVLAALVLAVGFTRSLRRPLFALAEGAAALRDGRLSHRIALTGRDEFGEAARSMNAMAEELSAHRGREQRARQDLESLVARRTAALTEALDQRKEAEERRRRLFADISHELRTPTTAIRGEAQIALRGGTKPAEEYRLSLGRIEEAARQLGASIDDLLTMARSDIDALSLRRAPVDLGAVLDEVMSLGTAMARAADVRLSGGGWTGPFTVLGDADRLRQMLLVLADNAIRYSRPDGEVRLSARRACGTVPAFEVTVADRGIGIDEVDLSAVFERGYRAANARRHRADGSGLGLPIARIIARGHGGDITLKRAPQGGTLAIVTLPMAPPPEGETE